ncbi:rhodanese-like domain-containing protein [uncultured Croceitalea sp.]|uniref:rhodanese-like domain-containing protein n=1 Tax=uncultured Croceitalea sp. TaxID=1798908 RepID=UPI00330571C2
MLRTFIFAKLNLIEKMDLTQEEWAEQLKNDENAFLLDVRTPEEVEEGYIPNSTNIDIYLGQEFLDEVEKLDKDKNFYVYCRSGNRSGQACAILKSVGIDNAYNLEGGFMNWEGEVAE